MSLKQTILGFLVEQPRHGYELKRVLSPALSRERTVNDGVLYPLLARMEREGLIRKTIEDGERTPKRHVFAPTARWREAFLTWLRTPVGEDDEVTYDFLLGHPFLNKCLFFRHLERVEIGAKLAAQKATASAKLAAFRRIRDGMRERRVDPYRLAILDLGILQQRDKLRWLDELLQGLERRGSPARRRRRASASARGARRAPDGAP